MRVDFPHFETLNQKAGGEQLGALYALVVAPLVKLLKGRS